MQLMPQPVKGSRVTVAQAVRRVKGLLALAAKLPLTYFPPWVRITSPPQL